VEVNSRKVDLGTAKMLIENISLGGMKIVSMLKLPIHSNMTFKFYFKLLKEVFEVDGMLVRINESADRLYYYGIKFELSVVDEDRLARVMNQLAVLRKQNKMLPDTNFIYENASLFLRKNSF